MSKRVQAKDVPDAVFLDRPATGGTDSLFAVRDAHPEFPPKVLRAKMASLVRRGLIKGCACGCRGDFTINPPARQFGHIAAADQPAPSDDDPGRAPFVNDAVFLRSPDGTDPRLAMREAFSVFMERTDGTNDMPWWLRVRWWHGGPWGLQKHTSLNGSMPGLILPPSITGVLPGLPVTDKESVYLTSSRSDALMYAARHDRPLLYEVTITVEPQPDDVIRTSTSVRVPSATIVRMETPSRAELRDVLRLMTGRVQN